jgi:hypothetical protein
VSDKIVPLNITELLMASDSTGNENQHLYAGTETGDVIRFSPTVFSDLDTAYPVEFQTHHDDHGVLMQEKTVGNIMVVLQPGGDYKPTFNIVFDYGKRMSNNRLLTMAPVGGAVFGTAVYGTDVWGDAGATRTEKVYGNGSGQTVGFKFSHNVANQPFLVGQLSYEIDGGAEDAGSASS